METISEKACLGCGLTKPLDCYYVKKGGRAGRAARCIQCCRTPEMLARAAAATRRYRATPAGALKEAEYRSSDNYKEYMVAYEATPGRKAAKSAYFSTPSYKAWAAEYERSSVRISAKRSRDRSPDRRKKQSLAAAIRNQRPETKAARAARMREFRATPRGAIECSVRNGVAAELRPGSKNGRRTFELLGYSVEDLRRHLEAQFTDGMGWHNYGKFGWHIDHIRPLATFNYETPDELGFKEAWSLRNLQPLWASENWAKGAKWPVTEERCQFG